MNKSNSQVATGSQNLRSVACTDAGAIFGKGDITHIVQAVFNAPVPTAQFQQTLRCRPSRWQDAHEVNDFDGGFPLFGARTGQFSGMSDARPIGLQIGTEFLTHSDHAVLHTTTMVIQGFGLLDLSMRISEIGSQIGLQCRFVAFDHKERIRLL